MGFLVFVLVVLIVALILLKLYVKIITRMCKSQICLVGKTAVVTGANCGIGYETALDFAKRGAKVILACRNRSKAEEARRKIIEETQNDNIIVRIIDMASFDSVRVFAKEINESEDKIDILVNNAGTYGTGHKTTEDGHPMLMQVNYFSSFLLTNLLINLLKKSTASRIVNVSSYVAKTVKEFDVNNIDTFTPNNREYSRSKLCNILFTIELAKKLQGTGVTAYSLHPGCIKTDIFNNINGLKKVVIMLLLKLFFISCEEGAQTTIHCSIDKGIEQYSGEHFDCCQRVGHYENASNPDLPEKLWEKTEELVGLKQQETLFM